MMNRTIRTEELQVGMHVTLHGAWFRHPFLSNTLLIESERQIEKIVRSGIRTVTLDLEKSRFRIDVPGEAGKAPGTIKPERRGGAVSAPPDALRESNQSVEEIVADRGAPPEEKARAVQPDAQREINQSVEEIVADHGAPPEEKARAVQQMSLRMMSHLLEHPTASNIQQAKQTISRIVDLIIRDDGTTKHLVEITSHDYQTYTHSVTVGFLGVSLSKILFRNSDGHDLHELGAGFFLHDIGKVRVDTAIINKPGRLSEQEMGVMRKHPSYGYQLLRKTGQLTGECRQIVLQHHERDDGTGYPRKLRGEEIHLYARICSIADVYEALTTERPYKARMSPFEALSLMKTEMLHHFQKDLFDRFVLLFAGG